MIAKPLQTLSKLIVWVALALLSVLIIVGLIIQFYLFPNIDQYKGYITDKITEKTQLSAEIGHLKVGWEEFHPQLTVSEITLKDNQQTPVLQFKNTQAAISFFSLLKLSPVLSRLAVVDPKVTIERTETGEILVAGISTQGNNKPTLTDWLLKQHRISIQNATVTWLDRQRSAPAFHLNKLNLYLHNPRLLGLLEEHQLTISFTPSVGSNKPVLIKGKLYGDTVEEIKNNRNHLSLQFDNADLTAFRPWVDYPKQLKSAKGSAKFGLLTDHLTLQSVDANLALTQLGFTAPKQHEVLTIKNLTGRVEWEQYQQQQIVRVTNADLTLDSHKLNKLSAQYQHKAADTTQQQFTLDLPALNLHSLSVINKLLPAEHQARLYLAAIQPQGQLSDLSLSLKTAGQQLEALSVKADFDKLSLTAHEAIPGVNNLSGDINATKTSGRLNLTGNQSRVDLQKILRNPIEDNQLNAKLSWTVKPNNTSIAIKQFKINNPDLSGNVTGQVDLKPEGPFVNITGNFKQFEMQSVKHYLPRFLKPMTLRWLDNAFLAGTGNNVKLRFNGPGKQFPFTDQNHQYDPNIGVFTVTSQIKNATVHYGTNWPDVNNVDLTFAFAGPTLTLKNATGTLMESKITHADFEIPTLETKDPHLLIKGDVLATVPQAIDFINNSPVHRVTQGFTDDLITQGNGTLDLTMDIPLKRSKEAELEGIYTVTNGEMRSDGIPEITQINGKFRFTEDILAAKALTAKAFDTDVKVDVKSGENKSVFVTASGIATPTLFNHFVSHADYYVSGESPFTTDIKIQKPNVTIDIQSDLVGMESYLPAPFNKTAEMPLTMQLIKQRTPETQTWQLQLGKRLAGELALSQQGDQLNLKSAHLALDDTDAAITLTDTLPKLKQNSLNLQANVNHLNLDTWKTVFEHLVPQGEQQQKFDFSPRYEINANTMDAIGRRFNHVKISHSDVSDFIDIESDAVQGRISWDAAGQGKLIGRLAHLSIPASAPAASNENPLLPESEKNAVAVNQDDYPTLDIQSKQFMLGGKAMGGLILFASPTQENWSIKRFSLYNNDSTLNATGLWKNTFSPETSLDFNWEIEDLGKMLARLGHPEAISKGKGYLKGKLNWPSSPHTFDVLNLNGGVSFELKSGQFLKVKPGVGRLLGLVSLQSLPRRLTLDFSDLFSQGFAFDKISADLAINNGIMRSDNFEMSGPAADVQMQGSTNLKEETQDLNVKVMPKISDSVSLAALAGGPLAGAVAFLAQKVLKDPLNKIISTEYQIVGTWDEPEEVKKPAKAAQQQTGIQ